MGVKISELLPKPALIDTGTGEFSVHALDLKEIVELITEYREGMAMLFDGGMAGKDLTPVVAKAPFMVRDIIAKAADVDDPEEVNAIEHLPGTVQLVALMEIWKLTVPQPKKMLQLLSMVREQLEAQSPEQKSPAPIPEIESSQP